MSSGAVSLCSPSSAMFRASPALFAVSADERARASKLRSAAFEKKMKQRERIAKKKAAEQVKAFNAKEREKKSKERKLAIEAAAKEKIVAKKLKEKAEHVKRALSPYMYFVKEKYNAIAEKHGVKGVHAMKIVGAEFKKLTDAQKAPYVKQAEADKKRSTEERAEKKAERAKTTKLSSFVVFCNAERPKLVAASPQLTFTEVGRALGEKWRSLTAAQKAKYGAPAAAKK